MASALLSRDEFLAKFPNHVLVAWRFKDNKVWEHANIKINVPVSMSTQLNTIKDKWDIFFTPNGDYKKVFKDNVVSVGKTKQSVLDIDGNIYSFSCDNDSWEKIYDEIWLKPTIVVKTKHWYHMHFLLSNPVSSKTYLKRWEAIENMFVPLLKADNKAKDIARLFRVPEYTYRADNTWDTVIEVEEYNAEEVYSFDEWEQRISGLYNAVCSDDREKEDMKKKYKWKATSNIIDMVFDKISDISALDVLEDLYPEYKGIWLSIKASWEMTWWYKLWKSQNFVKDFSHDDRPYWWPYKIAKEKFRSLDVILNYFNDRWWVKVDDIRKSIASVEEITFTEIASSEEWWVHKKIWNFWNNSEWITIDEKKMEIRWYTGDANDIPFINALITPIGYIMMDTSTKTHVIIIQKSWREPRVVLLPLCSNLKEFRKFLMQYGIMIPDKAKFYIHVFDYVYKSDVPEYFYTNKLWLQELWGNRIVIEKTWEYIDNKKRIFVQILDTQDDKIVIEDNPASFKDYMEQLIQWYGWRISVPIALTMILWVNSYYFREADMQVPQMFVFWLSQCWKTTMLNNIFRSFGINKDISAGSKAFIYEKYARHYIPTHFSEYRNSAHKQSEIIEWFMRNLFDGSAIEKGRWDQTTVKYEANGLYIFDGQTIFTDDAVLTRMIILMANNIDKLELTALNTLPNIYKQSSYIFSDEWAFQKYVKIIKSAYTDIKKRIKFVRNNDRMIQNYSYLYALCDYLWIPEFKPYLDESIQAQDGMTAQDDIQIIYSKVFNMQYAYKFPCEIYHKGILISASEEGIRFNSNMEDLKWFVKTINTNFLWTNTLWWLKLYVDLQYIYDHPGIRWEFFRALHTMYSLEDKNSLTPTERQTIWSLRAFLQKNKPDHRLASDLNADLLDKWQTWKRTWTSSEVDFD